MARIARHAPPSLPFPCTILCSLAEEHNEENNVENGGRKVTIFSEPLSKLGMPEEALGWRQTSMARCVFIYTVHTKETQQRLTAALLLEERKLSLFPREKLDSFFLCEFMVKFRPTESEKWSLLLN